MWDDFQRTMTLIWEEQGMRKKQFRDNVHHHNKVPWMRPFLIVISRRRNSLRKAPAQRSPGLATHRCERWRVYQCWKDPATFSMVFFSASFNALHGSVILKANKCGAHYTNGTCTRMHCIHECIVHTNVSYARMYRSHESSVHTNTLYTQMHRSHECTCTRMHCTHECIVYIYVCRKFVYSVHANECTNRHDSQAKKAGQHKIEFVK